MINHGSNVIPIAAVCHVAARGAWPLPPVLFFTFYATITIDIFKTSEMDIVILYITQRNSSSGCEWSRKLGGVVETTQYQRAITGMVNEQTLARSRVSLLARRVDEFS